MRNGTRSQRGFTLAEFSIASGMTMAVMAGAFTLMNTVFVSNAAVGYMMETQHGARVTINMLARDILTAGTGLPNAGIPVPNGAGSTALVRQGLGGALPTANNVLAILTPGNGAGPALSGVATDALTLVTVDPDSPTWTVSAVNLGANTVTFVEDVRTAPNQMFPDNVLVFNNANGIVFGVVTAVSVAASEATFAANDPMNFNQPGAASGNLASIANAGGPPTTYPQTTVTRVMVISYYIDSSNGAHPRLIRKVNAQAPQIVAEDVVNLQFAYELFDFTTNVANANQPTTATPNQIRAVNISVTGRSPQRLRPNNQYYHFSLQSTVNVRNTTFRNRY